MVDSYFYTSEVYINQCDDQKMPKIEIINIDLVTDRVTFYNKSNDYKGHKKSRVYRQSDRQYFNT